MSDFRDFFSKNAENYSKSISHKSGSDLNELIERLNPGKDQTAIDLAAGTGFTALALSKRVARVVAFDGTEEMLDEAKKISAKEGILNIDFVLGNVESIPFPDSSFDIATCRRAAHHFTDKAKFLAEVFRILKPGGKIGIADMTRPETDDLDFFNELEKIRDTSHASAETVPAWKSLVEKAGFSLLEVVEMNEEFPLEKWLYPVKPDTPQGQKAYDAMAKASEDTLRRTKIDMEKRILTKGRIVLIASKP